MHANYTLIQDKVNSFAPLWEHLKEVAYAKTYYRDTYFVDLQIHELKLFLALKATMKDVDETKLSPSVLVDEMWQILASFTEEYLQLCQAILPDEEQVRLIHFNPAKNLPFNRQQRFAKYQDTLLLYRAIIGSPPAIIWPALLSKPEDNSQSYDVIELHSTHDNVGNVVGASNSDLFVTIQDKAQNLQLSFKVQRTLKLDRLFTEYCSKLCFLRGSVKFMFDGRRLSGEEKVSELIFKDKNATILAYCK